ncbi:ABC transporter permease [Halolamina sp. C58]|uniref:ABC transporter permease n=1 Tax=Halolamina sp. C58 TaxID=3421640 RepID=UPI003EB9E00D
MTRVWPLLIALSKDWLRNREAVFFAFLFPVILLLIFSAVFGGASAEFTVHVQNNDIGPEGEPTNLSTTFIDALEEVDALTIRTVPPGQNITEWSRQRRSAGATRVVVIQDGFADRVRAGSRQARRSVVLDTMARAGGQINQTTRARIRQGLNATGNGTNATGPAAVVFLSASDDQAAPAIRGILSSVVAQFNSRAIGMDTPPTTVVSEELGNRNVKGVGYFLPALIAAVVMINGLITLPALLAEFSGDGTLKRLIATPLRKRDWILANVLQQAVLALLITGVMVGVAHLVFDVTVIPGPLAIGLILLGAVTFTGFGMTLGSLVDGSDAATSLGMAVALPMMFVSGVFWELDLMPEYLQTVATLMPLYHFHRGLRRLMVLETTQGVGVPFAILGGGALIALVVAIHVTQWQNL